MPIEPSTGQVLLHKHPKATSAEVTTGTDPDKIITPKALKDAGIVSGGMVYTDSRFKIVTTTHDVSVTGTQTITGAGFTPKGAVILATIQNTLHATWGLDDGTTPVGLYFDPRSGNQISQDTNRSITIMTGAANPDYAQAYFSSFNTDGGVLTWSKGNSPTGTATLLIMFFR